MATLRDVVNKLKDISLLQPAVNSVSDGDPYEILNSDRRIRYATVVVNQRVHTERIEDNGIIRYRFFIIYADRLVHNLEENRLEIQSNAIDILRNIIWTANQELDWEFTKITYHPFTQKFADELAGAYADVEIEAPLDWLCDEVYGEI